MIRRSKKKWKIKPEIDKLCISDPSEFVSQAHKSRQIAAYQEDFTKEMQLRNQKKLRSPKNRSKCMWHRSKSLPPKTVSFCPYVLHRFTHAPTKMKAEVCRNKSCTGCRPRSGSRKTKKMATETNSPNTHGADSCFLSENGCLACEHRKTNEINASLKYDLGHTCSNKDYSATCWSGPPQALHSGHYGEGHISSYQSPGSGLSNPSYHRGNCSSAGSAYIKDLGQTRTPWVCVKRSLHGSPCSKNWGAVAKHDYLMAKYSEHNCPRTHPSRADYFSFQKHSCDVSHKIGNSTYNKSPSSWLPFVSTIRNRSHSHARAPTRSDIATKSSLRSSGNSFDNYCFEPSLASHDRIAREFSRSDAYQSEAMRELMYDAMSKQYINESFNGAASAKSDSELNSKFEKRKSPTTAILSTENTVGSHVSMNRKVNIKNDFADDMKLLSRCFNMSTTNPLSSVSGFPHVKQGNYFFRSRSLTPGRAHYNDSDNHVRGQHELGFVGSKSDRSHYDHRGKFDQWKSSDFILDKWKCSEVSFDKWKNGEVSFDKWKGSGIHFDKWKGSDSGFDKWKDSNVTFDKWKGSGAKFDKWKYSNSNFDKWNCSSRKLDEFKQSQNCVSNNNFLKSCANNSSDRTSNSRLTSDSRTIANSSVCDNHWRTKSGKSEKLVLPKAIDTDTYFTSKFGDTDTTGVCDKFSSWCGANIVNPEQTSRKAIEKTRETVAKTSIMQEDATDRISKDFTNLCAMKRELSLSPIRLRKQPSVNNVQVKSYLKEANMSYEHPKRLSGLFHCDSLGTMDKTLDHVSNSSECQVSKYHRPYHYSRSSSFILNAGNVNMNQSQNNGPNTSFQSGTASLSSYYMSNNFNSITGNRSFLDHLNTNGKHSPIEKSGSLQLYSSACCNNSAQMLSSLVEQEADRLKKIAGVIEQQQDISKNAEQ